MKLSRLTDAIQVTAIVPGSPSLPADPDVSALTADSRQAAAGSMFVAVRGVSVDGHSFLPSLAGRHLAAAVVESLPAELDPEVIYVVVPDTAVALGSLASRWYGDPSRHLRLVGVTGTNGKTTVATLIYEMARMMGEKAGLLSTVVNIIDETHVHSTHTTPDPISINALLARMVEAGCTVAAMEVSSHAAHQHRIAGLHFVGGVFTNLTRDHLDYHRTVEAYRDAKKSFFDSLPPSAWALTNIDDRNGEFMLQNTPAARHTYSLRSLADFKGRIIEPRLDGTLMSFNGREVEVLFTGRFNAYNLTAIYGASVLLGWNVDDILIAMSRLVPVAGRFQTFRHPSGVTAIVDYAHTPDAVVNVLSAIREVIGSSASVITVVGAGGNRDKGKRPIMAREAARLSDRLILTSDNPRDEDPLLILADMEAGLDEAARANTVSIPDRAQAIRMAVSLASPADVILIAGKGHEDYQEIRGVRHHFDDREQVRSLGFV